MADIIIFTDGSSRGNPGPGGWGAIVIARAEEGTKSPHVTELGGREDHTTNNRMEIMAAVSGLSRAPEDSCVTVFTDSSYVINGITRWIHGWKRNGWKTKLKEDVVNKDLWMELSSLASKRNVNWKYVGGHIGVIGNERCDAIATGFADEDGVDLYDGPLSAYSFPDVLDVSHHPMKLESKKSSSSHSRAKAFSYVSMVGGKIETHRTWAECEKRVKGAKGARFKKSIDAHDEAKIREEFSKGK